MHVPREKQPASKTDPVGRMQIGYNYAFVPQHEPQHHVSLLVRVFSPLGDDEVDECARGEHLRAVVRVGQAALQVQPERRVVLAVLPAHAKEQVAASADHRPLEHWVEGRVDVLGAVLDDHGVALLDGRHHLLHPLRLRAMDWSFTFTFRSFIFSVVRPSEPHYRIFV